MQVAVRLETVGLMVYRRVVPLGVVWDLMGGMTMSSWDRLKGWIDATRAEQQNEKFAEWIEWLVNQLSTQVSATTPAHLREMDWKP
jgi:hypothetical protein